eukprot:14500026-Ditylum_brightwellii.AAC.1
MAHMSSPFCAASGYDVMRLDTNEAAGRGRMAHAKWSGRARHMPLEKQGRVISVLTSCACSADCMRCNASCHSLFQMKADKVVSSAFSPADATDPEGDITWTALFEERPSYPIFLE